MNRKLSHRFRYPHNRHTQFRRSGKGLTRRVTSAGFTLPEVLVVIMVIGILFTIASPGWLALRNTITINAAQDIVFQAMRQAQIQAKQSHLAWQVSFQEVNGKVQWASHIAGNLPSSTDWQTIGGVRIDPIQTTLANSNDLYRMQFNLKGNANGQLGKLTLLIDEANSMRRCVFVSTLLGALRKSDNCSSST